MKKIYLLLACALTSGIAISQCASSVTLGTSSNLFTIIRNGQNPIAADKDLNMVAFVHRNNAGTFGGNSGHLRYDISLNGGTSWVLDQGVLNPLNTNLARYPNMTIYNPASNTNPNNAYVSYMAATINSINSTWNGLVSGVRQVTGTGNTENYNQPVMNPQLIPHSVVKGAPGVFWAIDALYNGVSLTGFAIYKGTWNSATNDITWAHNFSVSPTFLAGPGQDYNIAFDPSGQIGWFCTNAHVSGTLGTAAYYPTLWKTTNGGTSWSGPYTVDLTKMGCFSNFIQTNYTPSTSFEHDLVVDINGNPHIFTTIMNSMNYGIYFGMTHWMYDITLKNGVWAAYPVASVNGGQGLWGSGGDIAVMYQSPQAARSADGTKVFFTWADNSNYNLGAANISPNLFTKAFDVVQETWTQSKDVTSCNTSIAGKILFPHIAPEVLEPGTGQYKIAAVYAGMAVANDPVQTSNFYFLDNITYSASEFSLALPAHSVTIQQGNSLLLCNNATVNINITGGAGEAIWNTGATSPTIAVSSNTNNMYIVTAQKNCIVGIDTITVTDMTVNPVVTSGPTCPGNTVAVSVTGNATSYTWFPGAVNGSAAVLIAGTTPEFTLNAQGTDCVSQHTVAISLLTPPVVSIDGADTTCYGAIYHYTAQGASTYDWSDGSSGQVLTITPTQNTMYTVIGTAANTCTNAATVNLIVIPSPTLITSQSHTSICAGASASLVAIGVNTWSWNTGAITNTLLITPANTSTYEVTGTALNGCTASHIYTMVVHPLPSLTVTSTRSVLCVGERAMLTASGAQSYTWSIPFSGGNTTVQITPTITTSYTLSGKSTQGCVNTMTFQQIVSGCAGTEEIVEDIWNIYPNPSQGAVFITGIVKDLQVFDQLGREIYKQEGVAGQQLIKLEFAKPGLYFIRSGRDVRKLIVSD